jgi:3-deoxy-D-manno-octulosonate 8-phosphate phosphatase KdsC-like HAD superfamily phosphatase
MVNPNALYATMFAYEIQEKAFTLESLAKDFNVKVEDIVFVIDYLKDLKALNWSVDVEGRLELELLADLSY